MKMSKLAKEITKAARQRGLLSSGTRGASTATEIYINHTFEAFIAAHLEPVKRMVLDLVRVGNDMAAIPTPHPEIEISEARAMIMTPQAQWAELCKHDSTLALLSDEETKP